MEKAPESTLSLVLRSCTYCLLALAILTIWFGGELFKGHLHMDGIQAETNAIGLGLVFGITGVFLRVVRLRLRKAQLAAAAQPAETK